MVLTHLLSATHQQFSQLEKLVFSEHFVKEEPSITSGLTPGTLFIDEKFCNHTTPHEDVLSLAFLTMHYTYRMSSNSVSYYYLVVATLGD